MKEFKVGDKVRVISSQISSASIRVGMVSEIDEIRGGYYPYSLKDDDKWLWSDKELELVTNSKVTKITPYMRKKYVLLKDMAHVKKGAIYEEVSDDGKQDFNLISKESIKFEDRHSFIMTRKSVTDNPKWFKEVTIMYIAKEHAKKVEKFLKKLI